MESLIEKMYDNNVVEFIYKNKDDIMINATQMAKIFGTEVSSFTKTGQTQNFIKALCQTENLPYGDEFSPNGKLIKVVKGDPSVSGTWMRREVALKFAAWMDPFFEVWIMKTIDHLLYDYAHRQESSIKRSVELRRRNDALVNRLMNNSEDFRELSKVQEQLRIEKSKRTQNTRAKFSKEYSLFDLVNENE